MLKPVRNFTKPTVHPSKSELRQAQNDAFAALPHGSETSSSKPLKEKDKAAQSLDKKRGATQPGQRQNQVPRQCMRKSQTPPKSELRQAQKRWVRNPSTRVRNVLFETVKREGQSSAVAGQKTWRNPAWTKTKIKLIGNACETAKHHLNPSSDNPKRCVRSPSTRVRNVLFETVTREGKQRSRWTKNVSASAMHAKKPNTT